MDYTLYERIKIMCAAKKKKTVLSEVEVSLVFLLHWAKKHLVYIQMLCWYTNLTRKKIDYRFYRLENE